MAAEFKTPAWKPIRDRKSKLCQLLFEFIAHKKQSDSYDFESLMLMGALYTQDRKSSRGKASDLFAFLQGHSTQQEHIAAGDKDWIPLMNKHFSIVTALALKGSKQDELYQTGEIKNISEKIKPNRDSAFSRVLGLDDEYESVLDDIFHTYGKLTKDRFTEIVTDKASWVFDAAVIRNKIFDQAEVEIKHISSRGLFKRSSTVATPARSQIN